MTRNIKVSYCIYPPNYVPDFKKPQTFRTAKTLRRAKGIAQSMGNGSEIVRHIEYRYAFHSNEKGKVYSTVSLCTRVWSYWYGDLILTDIPWKTCKHYTKGY